MEKERVSIFMLRRGAKATLLLTGFPQVSGVFLSEKYGGLFKHFAYLGKRMSRQAYCSLLAYNGGKSHSLARLLDVLGLKDIC